VSKAKLWPDPQHLIPAAGYEGARAVAGLSTLYLLSGRRGLCTRERLDSACFPLLWPKADFSEPAQHLSHT